MNRIWCAITLTTLLAGCSGLNQPTAQVIAAPRRELTPVEKLSFVPVLAAGLKDPSAAQFKWMPVILTERDGITDYCGLVNGKNSYGGYTGFVRFYAQLQKDDKGQFVKATLRSMSRRTENRMRLIPGGSTASASNSGTKISVWQNNCGGHFLKNDRRSLFEVESR
jgi:hypothetical protein